MVVGAPPDVSSFGRTRVISVARDFSPVPGGRHPRNGPFSGEEFRERTLVPALQDVPGRYSRVVVDLDGADTYIGSFLEEVFGGLLRTHFRDKRIAEVERLLEVRGTGEFEFFRDLAMDYMRKQDTKNIRGR